MHTHTETDTHTHRHADTHTHRQTHTHTSLSPGNLKGSLTGRLGGHYKDRNFII